MVAGLAGVGPAEFGRRDGLQFREDAGGVVAAAERAENEQLVGGVGEHDPLAFACSYQRAGGECHWLAFPKVPACWASSARPVVVGLEPDDGPAGGE